MLLDRESIFHRGWHAASMKQPARCSAIEFLSSSSTRVISFTPDIFPKGRYIICLRRRNTLSRRYHVPARATQGMLYIYRD